MKIKLGIPIALAVCGIVGIYVVNTGSLHDKTLAVNTVSKNAHKISNDTSKRKTDPQPSVSGKSAQATQTVAANSNSGAAKASLTDVRTLDIIDKLNNLDGSERENLRRAFALNKDYDFQTIQTKQDRKGNQHTRYRQTYQDIPVWGEQVLLHKGIPGDYYSANGKVANGLEFSGLNTLLANVDRSESALNRAVRTVKTTKKHLSANWTTRNAKSELVIYLDEQNQAQPAYAVSYLAIPREGASASAIALQSVAIPQKPTALELAEIRLNALKQTHLQPTRPHVLLDPVTNNILKQWDGLNTADAHGPGGNEKTGRYEFGVDYPALLVSQAGDTCSMNNHKVKTVDLQNGFFLGDKAHTFPCPENNHKEINGAYSPLNDAHYFGGLVFDMYQEWFYLPPLNFQLTMAVHYSQKFNNAFWTGQEMVFGDGQNRFYPLVDANVSAHEVSHGFTEQNSGLFYFDQSGGMNEAFSDIAGEAAEYYWKGEVDWLVGADIFIGEGGFLRAFEDPTRDGVSIGHADDFVPFLDVHYSSGVYNRAFYLLANTANWDIRKAFEVFVMANQFYWEPSSTFVSGACGVLDAANDLGFEVRDVDQAFQTVGVNCGLVPFTDSDRDGMDNLWEMRFGLNSRNPDDANMDADGDGLVNVAEYHERTDPQNTDSDGDGINDLLELYVYKTNPNLADSDYDGVGDYDEREIWLTNPTIADTDEDGMPDGWEVKFGLAPRNPDGGGDSDGDGVSNLQEYTNQADPTLTDTDGDGLDDYAEINTHLTAPGLPDSDSDKINDADELARGTDPNSRDTDNDYLGDGKEIEIGSDPLNTDSDGDALPDGDEVSLWLTDPLNPDTDADGLPDGWEVQYGLNPLAPEDANLDLDEDGVSNVQEYEYGSNPLNPDSDFDGLSDFQEIFETKTDPNNSDTDGDTLADALEINLGLDPLNPEDAYLDSDGDGWLNIQEFALGTHLFSATEELDGLPAKPMVPEGAEIAASSNIACFHAETYDFCTAFFGVTYGWDARFTDEAVTALTFNSALPWTITGASLGFSASTFENQRDLTATISMVETSFTSEDTIDLGLNSAEYWTTVKNSPPLASITMPALQDSPFDVSLNLPFDRLNGQDIIIGKRIDGLLKSPIESEVVFDDFISPNRLNVTFAPDVDEDGITDDWEALYELDPSNPADALADRDDDGASNLQEYVFRTNPDLVDSDEDGMPDGWEIRYGLDPTADDSQLDPDNDGLVNIDEFTNNTSPLRADTDGDGVDDMLSMEMTAAQLEEVKLAAPGDQAQEDKVL